MMENFGDTPFYPDNVPPETIAAMTMIATKVRSMTNLPFGINVLRNDGMAAISIAHAAGADFVRINVFAGARVTDQGLINAQAHLVMRHAKRIGASRIKVLADVDVKHSAPLGPYVMEHEVKDLSSRAGAGGLIVSGRGTGEPVDPSDVLTARAVTDLPIFIGSGFNAKNAKDLWPVADGAIVGTAFKHGGDPNAPVEVNLVRNLMASL